MAVKPHNVFLDALPVFVSLEISLAPGVKQLSTLASRLFHSGAFSSSWRNRRVLQDPCSDTLSRSPWSDTSLWPIFGREWTRAPLHTCRSKDRHALTLITAARTPRGPIWVTVTLPVTVKSAPTPTTWRRFWDCILGVTDGNVWSGQWELLLTKRPSQLRWRPRCRAQHFGNNEFSVGAAMIQSWINCLSWQLTYVGQFIWSTSLSVCKTKLLP